MNRFGYLFREIWISTWDFYCYYSPPNLYYFQTSNRNRPGRLRFFFSSSLWELNLGKHKFPLYITQVSAEYGSSLSLKDEYSPKPPDCISPREPQAKESCTKQGKIKSEPKFEVSWVEPRSGAEEKIEEPKLVNHYSRYKLAWANPWSSSEQEALDFRGKPNLNSRSANRESHIIDERVLIAFVHLWFATFHF